jgi:hypothetical protein
MNPLLQLAIQETPAIIALLRDAFKKQNAGQPIPTDAEVVAAWGAAFLSSLAKDENWLATHGG